MHTTILLKMNQINMAYIQAYSHYVIILVDLNTFTALNV